MYEYNFLIDMWYFHTSEIHGKLDAGLYMAVPYEILEWFDNEEDYLIRLER